LDNIFFINETKTTEAEGVIGKKEKKSKRKKVNQKERKEIEKKSFRRKQQKLGVKET